MVELKTLTGSSIELEPAAIARELTGRTLYAGSDGYDEARTIWNAMIDRRPGIIVQVASERDVSKTIEFARRRNLPVAVKGGGHNIAGKALVDGGIVIDFKAMRKVDVDAKRRTARVEPGATLADVDKATQAHGLTVPTGINSTTGIAGLTLGGGFGWTTRRYGLTIDNLRSARLVVASGEILPIDREHSADLFWAIRGGGGNFGVVTEFQFDLHPLGPQVLAGMYVHPFGDFESIMPAYQGAMRDAPDELSCWLVLRRAPPLPFIPSEWHGKEVVVMALCYAGRPEDAEHPVSVFGDIGRPIAKMIERMPFIGWQAAFDPLLTAGARNYWKSHDIAGFDDATVALLRKGVSSLPTDECELFIANLSGQMTRVRADATAWPNREPHYVVNMHTRWRDERDDTRCRNWARKLHKALSPHAMGTIYVNFIPEGDEDAVKTAYGANYARLQKIKREVDPANLLRANQNIAPGA